ncbi:hypothetical protein BLX24_20450 [Arsenicibacter rosenii]|uniref:O-antigen ligase-related domain-containing protein n=2 Tax=Arsenicibacter rosenii TaxID=1750698 RepID=A0A1S2VF63_9BACT|nr:hypothetical protein BLX24_20450 [Arsenicibacter rosenii]
MTTRQSGKKQTASLKPQPAVKETDLSNGNKVKGSKGEFIRKSIFFLLLLSLFTPLVYSASSFFGFVAIRGLYFRILAEGMALLWLFLPARHNASGSWLQLSLILFLLIVALADTAGVDPAQSIFSGFMRMEGFTGYLHLGLYALVVSGTGLTSKQWDWLFIASTAIALSVLVIGYVSPTGWLGDHYRFVATVGQPAFLAAYLLIHIFLAIYIGTKATWISTTIRIPVILFVCVALSWGIVLSGARSGILGLGGGLVLWGLSWLWNRFRSLPLLIGVAGMAVISLVGSYWLLQRKPLFQTIAGVNRLTNLSGGNNTLPARQITNAMAFRSFLDHPLRGWGQENYSYAFPKNYDADLVAGDGTEWYDRIHCVPLEWAFSAGIPGIIAWLAIWVFFLLKIRSFSAPEAGVLLAVGGGYFIFGLLNPDNLLAAQFFFLLTGFVGKETDQRAGTIFRFLAQGRNAVKIGLAALIAWLGYVSINAGLTLKKLNSQVTETNGFERMNKLKAIYDQSIIGRYEVADLVADFAISVWQEPNAPIEAKKFCYNQALAVMENQRLEQPDYGRLLLRVSSLHSSAGEFGKAVQAIQQSMAIDGPKRPATWMLLGDAYLSQGKPENALDAYRRAADLQPEWQLPLIMQAQAAAFRMDKQAVYSLTNRLTTRGLIEHLASVKQAYQRISDLPGFISRISAVPEGERFMFNRQVYHEWALTAFDLSLTQQTVAALNDFDRHFMEYHARFSRSEIDQLIANSQLGIRPDKLMEISARLPVSDSVPEW